MDFEIEAFQEKEEQSILAKNRKKLIMLTSTLLLIILLIILTITITAKTSDNTNNQNLSPNNSTINTKNKTDSPSNEIPNPNINEFDLNLEYFPESSQAKCLDGTPYGVYFARGYAAGSKKVVINFWGHSWCTGRNQSEFLASCSTRIDSDYGSSKYFKAHYNYEYDFLGKEEYKNKFFYNWNKFDIPYCDGALGQGSHKEPFLFDNTTKLYFRGYENTIAALDFLFNKKLNLNELDTIVVSGCSSGGFTMIYWLQFIADLVASKNKNASVIGISAGGFFFDYKNTETNDNDFGLQMKQIYETVNSESPIVNKDCIADYSENPYLCLLPENLIKYIKVPLLLFQAAFDSWTIRNILGESCHEVDYTLNNCNENQLGNITKVKDYAKSLLVEAAKINKNLSVWSPACIFHCFLNFLRDSRSFAVEGRNINDVIFEFLESKGQKQILLFDKFERPDQRQCN